MNKIWKFWPQCDRRAFAHIHIQSGALWQGRWPLFSGFHSAFPWQQQPTSAELYRNKAVRSGEYLLVIANYSALYKGVRLPVGSLNMSKKGSYYILTTAGFSYLAQRFLCDSRNLTQKSCEIVWCQIVFVWFQVIKGAFPKLLNE